MFVHDLSVNIGGLKLLNPVVTASGTFGVTDEYMPYIDYDKLGAVTTKSVTLHPRTGNASPRIWETASGMLNAIGLENKGIAHFMRTAVPFFERFTDVKLIVSIAGNDGDDYGAIAQEIQAHPRVDALEINVSCPNVKHGGVAFLQDTDACCRIVEDVRKHFDRPIFVKLSPEARDMQALATEVMHAGASGITLINTLKGMAIDTETRRPRLGNVTGGLSGPAIKPVALRYVYELKQALDIPVIAGGGILSAEDALEFIIAGAEGVSIGTANFVEPQTGLWVIDGIIKYLERHNTSLSRIRTTLQA